MPAAAIIRFDQTWQNVPAAKCDWLRRVRDPRASQDMAFDAQDRAYAVFVWACTRGICDSEA